MELVDRGFTVLVDYGEVGSGAIGEILAVNIIVIGIDLAHII